MLHQPANLHTLDQSSHASQFYIQHIKRQWQDLPCKGLAGNLRIKKDDGRKRVALNWVYKLNLTG